MRYVYILLICLILFYIISRYFEKYYSQENFDPSLVPVSSIITLAKVAQKIVDGNGTLTNPANLNIGTTSAKGNLLVTGNSTTNGNKQIDGTLGVTGATTLSNTLGVTGATTLSGGVTGNTNFAAATIGVSSPIGTPGASSTPAATNLTVNGATKITGDVTLASHTLSTDPTKAYFLVKNKAGATSLSVGQGGDTFISSLNVSGGISANGSIGVNGNLGILYPGQSYGTFGIVPTSAGATLIKGDNITFADSNANMDVTSKLTASGTVNINSLNVNSLGIGNSTKGIITTQIINKGKLSGQPPAGGLNIYSNTSYPWKIIATAIQYDPSGYFSNASQISSFVWGSGSAQTIYVMNWSCWSYGDGQYKFSGNNPAGYTTYWVTEVTTYNIS